MNHERVIALINSAFESVREPEKDLITGCTCEECLEIREDFAGKQPEELEDDRMRFHSWDMGFLTPEARQYYLPGWMRLGITQPQSNCTAGVIQQKSCPNIEKGYSEVQIGYSNIEIAYSSLQIRYLSLPNGDSSPGFGYSMKQKGGSEEDFAPLVKGPDWTLAFTAFSNSGVREICMASCYKH